MLEIAIAPARFKTALVAALRRGILRGRKIAPVTMILTPAAPAAAPAAMCPAATTATVAGWTEALPALIRPVVALCAGRAVTARLKVLARWSVGVADVLLRRDAGLGFARLGNFVWDGFVSIRTGSRCFVSII